MEALPRLAPASIRCCDALRPAAPLWTLLRRLGTPPFAPASSKRLPFRPSVMFAAQVPQDVLEPILLLASESVFDSGVEDGDGWLYRSSSLAYALVCRHWTNSALRALYRHVHLDWNATSWQSILRSLSTIRQVAADFLNLTVSLQIDSTSMPDAAIEPQVLLAFFPRLRAIWLPTIDAAVPTYLIDRLDLLVSVNLGGLDDPAVQLLAQLPSLQELQIDSPFDLDTEPGSRPFQTLIKLSIHGPMPDAVFNGTMPALQELQLRGYWSSAREDLEPVVVKSPLTKVVLDAKATEAAGRFGLPDLGPHLRTIHYFAPLSTRTGDIAIVHKSLGEHALLLHGPKVKTVIHASQSTASLILTMIDRMLNAPRRWRTSKLTIMTILWHGPRCKALNVCDNSSISLSTLRRRMQSGDGEVAFDGEVEALFGCSG